MKLSVCLATFNEEQNLERCLKSVKAIADEIVIVDGTSQDKTVEIAKKYAAKIIITENKANFHINKQMAIDASKGEWILQLDADEVVSPELAMELRKITTMTEAEIEKYEAELPQKRLFLRHQQLIDQRDGNVGSTNGPFVAFYLPRLNYFLGKFLRYGGVYPDGAIRLIKNGKAYLPAKDVHEVMKVDGRVGWLQSDLYHYDSPTFERYMARNSRYINLIAADLKKQNYPKTVSSMLDYMLIKPVGWFFMTQIRHKGVLDGFQGIVFSFFSALRFPRAYFRYLHLK